MGEQQPGSLGELPGQRGVQRPWHSQCDQSRADAIRGQASQQRCARVIERTCHDQRCSKCAFMCLQRTFWKQRRDQLLLRHFDINPLQSIQVMRKANIHNLQFANIFKGRENQ